MIAGIAVLGVRRLVLSNAKRGERLVYSEPRRAALSLLSATK
jgi:hypothetical protein